MHQLAIVMIAEQDIYEQQARLLCESIFKFANQEVDFDIFVFSPRKDKKPNSQTAAYFKQHNIFHSTEDLNVDFDYFPLANSLFAADYFEKNFKEYKHILLCDCDTVFLNSFQPELLAGETVYAKIVDNIGVGSGGDGHKNDPFWQQIFRYFKLPLTEPNHETTVRVEPIRPYFNSGFVLANNMHGFFQQWLQDFITLMNSGIKPDYYGRDGTNFGFYEQLALSITLAKYDNNFSLLPLAYNYPIPFQPFLSEQVNHIAFDELVHIHYHKWFQHPGFLDHITTEQDKSTEQYLWLRDRLPLAPKISGEFKC